MKPKNADRADDLKERSGEFSSRSSDPRSTSTDSRVHDRFMQAL